MCGKWKDKVKYLGIILTMCDDADIRAKRGEFIGSVNRANAQFRVVPDQIRIRLLHTSRAYCLVWVSDVAPRYNSSQRDGC